jgi:hypothetical protein
LSGSQAAPTGLATVHLFEDFPADWEITACRSEDGTPILELQTAGEADHDSDQVPCIRVYVNDDIVHDHPAREEGTAAS